MKARQDTVWLRRCCVYDGALKWTFFGFAAMCIYIQHYFWPRCFALALLVSHSSGHGIVTYPSTCPEWRESSPAERFTSEDGAMCYVHVKTRVAWPTADKVCSTNRWSMLKIRSSNINDFFKEYAMRQNLHCLWIGLNDIDSEGDFRWTDGTAMTFGEVDDDFSLNEWLYDCVAMCRKQLSKEYSWEQRPCSGFLVTEWHFVCETDALIVTTTQAITTSTERDHGQPMKTKKPTRKSFVKLKAGIGCKLTAKADFSVKCHLPVVCARKCQQQESCAVINFHRSTGRCNGYSSRALKQGRKHQDSWEIWIKSNTY